MNGYKYPLYIKELEDIPIVYVEVETYFTPWAKMC